LPASPPIRGHAELILLLPVAGRGERQHPSSWTRRWRPELLATPLLVDPRPPLPLSPATAAPPMPLPPGRCGIRRGGVGSGGAARPMLPTPHGAAPRPPPQRDRYRSGPPPQRGARPRAATDPVDSDPSPSSPAGCRT
jgi:hypothetical protein